MKTHQLLFTGATGALGQPLLDELLRNAANERIYVLLRHAPRGRLPDRVTPVFGDIRHAGSLGLSAENRALLQRKITGVVHGAADTRFDAPYQEAYATNVAGTENVLRFAATCAQLDRFIHLGTLCASGKRTGRLREVPLEHRHGFVNHYEATKSAAEFVVRQARLPASIIRLSTVIGYESTGKIHQPGALHRALRLMYASLVPMMPARPHCPVDLISVEYATRAIAELTASRFTPGSIRHLCADRDYLPLDELLDLAYATFAHNRPAWRRRAIERPAMVDLETFHLFRKTVEETGAPGLIESLRLLSSFAPQLLYPKTYDDTACRRALEGTGIIRPDLREMFPRIVTSLIASREDHRVEIPAHQEAA